MWPTETINIYLTRHAFLSLLASEQLFEFRTNKMWVQRKLFQTLPDHTWYHTSYLSIFKNKRYNNNILLIEVDFCLIHENEQYEVTKIINLNNFWYYGHFLNIMKTLKKYLSLQKRYFPKIIYYRSKSYLSVHRYVYIKA